MKKTFIFLALICMAHRLSAQDSQQQKIDSVCHLVKQYWNEKNAGKIYDMAGESFRKQLNLENFEKVCNVNLFPLGDMKEPIFENFSNGVSKYKAAFDSINLSMFISLDKSDKLETFLFKPYSQ